MKRKRDFSADLSYVRIEIAVLLSVVTVKFYLFVLCADLFKKKRVTFLIEFCGAQIYKTRTVHIASVKLS